MKVRPNNKSENFRCTQKSQTETDKDDISEKSLKNTKNNNSVRQNCAKSAKNLTKVIYLAQIYRNLV